MNKSRILKTIITVAVVGGVFAYLIFDSMGSSMVYYKTVEELFNERSQFENRTVRVNGLLKDGSISQKPGTDEFRFILTKNSKELVVHYSGILPDTMATGRELVVEGILAGPGNEFEATEILTKCPSKYEETAKEKGGS